VLSHCIAGGLFSIQLTVAWVPTVERIRYPGYICSTLTLRSNGTVFPLSDNGDNPSTGNLSQYIVIYARETPRSMWCVCYCYPGLTQIGMWQKKKLLLNLPSVKYHKYPLNDFRIVTCHRTVRQIDRRTDKHGEAKRLSLQKPQNAVSAELLYYLYITYTW
jgi:hypothetical protein